MAQYTPKSWKASPAAVKAFTADHVAIRKLVSQRARKFFALSSISPEDLVQEGMIAALYAVDSYQQTRGKRDAYITTLVDNALAMIACESRASCRQPKTWVSNEMPTCEAVDALTHARCGLTVREHGKKTAHKYTLPDWRAGDMPPCEHREPTDLKKKPCRRPLIEHANLDHHYSVAEWRQVPVHEPVDPDMVEANITLSVSEEREEYLEQQERVYKSRQRLLKLRNRLRPEVAILLDLRMNPPVDLLVLARNILGRTVSLKSRMPNQAIASYLGMDVDTVAKAARELRDVLTAEYKVNS